MEEIIAVEIGGTNCRFGLFLLDKENNLNLIKFKLRKTKKYDSLDSIIKYIDKNLIKSKKNQKRKSTNEKKRLIIAVPGPVLGEKSIKMINVKWSIDKSSITKKQRNKYEIDFMNDVLAQAYGFLTKAGQENLKIIREGAVADRKDIIVVSSGTGLGHSFLKAVNDHYLECPSEAGHTVFPFIGDEEEEFRRFVYDKINEKYPTLNTIVSGLGLTLLYRYFTKKSYLQKKLLKKYQLILRL